MNVNKTCPILYFFRHTGQTTYLLSYLCLTRRLIIDRKPQVSQFDSYPRALKVNGVGNRRPFRISGNGIPNGQPRDNNDDEGRDDAVELGEQVQECSNTTSNQKQSCNTDAKVPSCSTGMDRFIVPTRPVNIKKFSPDLLSSSVANHDGFSQHCRRQCAPVA